MLKYLRIAVTALSLTASVMLLAWWARSYFIIDQISMRTSAHRSIWISGEQGHLHLNDTWMFADRAWHYWQTRLNARDRAVLRAAYREWQFGIDDVCGETHVAMPHWCPALLTAAVAGVPWIGQLRWRFSLRALLIATTLIAAVLGLIVASI